MDSSGGTWTSHMGGIHPQENESVERASRDTFGQKTAHLCFEKIHFEEILWPILNNTNRAMSRSQRGPLVATPFVSVPTNRFSKFDPHRPVCAAIASAAKWSSIRATRRSLGPTSRSCECWSTGTPSASPEVVLSSARERVVKLEAAWQLSGMQVVPRLLCSRVRCRVLHGSPLWMSR